MTGEPAKRMEEGEKARCAREGETIAGETGGVERGKCENEH